MSGVFYAQLVLSCLFIPIIIVLCLRLKSLITKTAPFIPIPKEVLGNIAEALNVKPGNTLFDLGCGDARVLLALSRACPETIAFGIEKNFYPYWLARLGTRRHKNITIKRRDFFTEDLHGATHIFTYLSHHAMDALLPKFLSELRPGTRLVSCTFPFTNKQPTRVIDLNRQPGQLARTLYVYEF